MRFSEKWLILFDDASFDACSNIAWSVVAIDVGRQSERKELK